MNKQKWIDAAEVFDMWRVSPRVVLFGYCYWVAHVTDETLLWYQHLPGNERTLEASGLAGALITGVTGLAVWVYKIYSDAGTDWVGRNAGMPMVRTTSTVATETVTK